AAALRHHARRRRRHQARPLPAHDRADRRGQVDPLLLQRDRGDGAALPPRARAARGPHRRRARGVRERRRGDRGRGGARSGSAVAPPSARGYRRRSRWQHIVIQSAPLLLALVILAAMATLYIGLFYHKLHKLPGNFEWTSVVNTSLPLVLAAVGQSIVV